MENILKIYALVKKIEFKTNLWLYLNGKYKRFNIQFQQEPELGNIEK